MEITICAYCYHEVERTPDGVCSYCGGNLAEEALEEIDNEFPSRMEKVQAFISGYPVPRKSRIERIQDVIEPNPQRLKRIREFLTESEIEQKSRERRAKKEMQELDNLTKIVGESETVKELVKSLGKPIIPFWFKFGAFLFGLIISAFYSFPSIQEPLLKTISLINSSPYLILAMSFIPILFLLIIIQKFDRRMF